MEKGRVYFLSDAHLGSGSDSLKRERELCAFLDSIKDDCGILFLLGDMFDFWFSYRHVVPRGHVRLLGKLAELVDDGVEVHFFTGNHDMWLFDYLEVECGVTMHCEPELFEIDGRRFLIGHGDGLGHTDKWFDILRLFFHSRVCQRLFTMLPSSLTFPFAHRWSDSNKMLHERQDKNHYLGDDREGIVIYCRQRLQKERFDYCIFGHRHLPMVMPLSESGSQKSTQYVNTGDWLTRRNYVVYDLSTHTLTLHDLSEEQAQ